MKKLVFKLTDGREMVLSSYDETLDKIVEDKSWIKVVHGCGILEREKARVWSPYLMGFVVEEEEND